MKKGAMKMQVNKWRIVHIISAVLAGAFGIVTIIFLVIHSLSNKKEYGYPPDTPRPESLH